MLFNSVHFLVFFPIVVLFYYCLPFRVQWIWLLFASFYFYMSWNPIYAILIAISIVITYTSGRLMGFIRNTVSAPTRQLSLCRWVVAFSFIINLAILFFFKYYDFVLDNLNYLLSLVNVQAVSLRFSFLLPVGISFYTFQALGYTMDVYRKDISPVKNLGKYALFVSFFPQLVAGPIERSSNLIRQFDKPRPLKYTNVKKGLIRMGWGLFMKVVVADWAAFIASPVFENYIEYSGFPVILAISLFAVQIYCDFAGYSEIAIGAAQVMGFELTPNFRQPYFAQSIREFWSRWHITLSTWFRDYLYIPLGGNRCSKLKKYRNLMITFLVSGLWHGASWNYVIWGGLHGTYQIVGEQTKPWKDKLYQKTGLANSKLLPVCKTVFTCLLVCFAWVFFGSEDLTAALELLHRATYGYNFSYFTSLIREQYIALAILSFSITILALVDCQREKGYTLTRLSQKPLALQWALYMALLLIVLLLGAYGPSTQNQFIYFQF